MIYYNEWDANAAAWLRELIHEGLLPEGEVDERSISDISPVDLVGYDQCHFFAGIGGWPLALRLAGLAGRKGIWTGSCPCQPFSAAGKRKGTADERHLWPEFFRLIRKCRPAVVFGEQVASKDGRDWLAGVRADLEGVAYAVGAADLCAAGVGAPHIRQRLWWVADAERHAGGQGRLAHAEPGRRSLSGPDGLPDIDDDADGLGRLADAMPAGRAERWPGAGSGQVAGGGGAGERLAHADSAGRRQAGRDAASDPQADCGRPGDRAGDAGAADGRGHWSRVVWLPCADGKARRVEPGIFPLAHGVPGRVGLLRGAGNAIVPQVAAEFILACGL